MNRQDYVNAIQEIDPNFQIRSTHRVSDLVRLLEEKRAAKKAAEDREAIRKIVGSDELTASIAQVDQDRAGSGLDFLRQAAFFVANASAAAEDNFVSLSRIKNLFRHYQATKEALGREVAGRSDLKVTEEHVQASLDRLLAEIQIVSLVSVCPMRPQDLMKEHARLVSPAPTETGLGVELNDEEKALAASPDYGLIRAIKAVRARTAMSLKDAKDVVDRYRSKLIEQGRLS